MDRYIAIAFKIFIILFVVFTWFGLCRRLKRRRTIISTPVVVTSATHTAPGAYPAQTMAVYPGMTYQQQNIYTPEPSYPVSGAPGQRPMQVPMQMPMPVSQPNMQPSPAGINTSVMPPYPTSGPSLNPPSYDLAVGMSSNPTQQHPSLYEKQAPYNPNYSGGH